MLINTYVINFNKKYLPFVILERLFSFNTLAWELQEGNLSSLKIGELKFTRAANTVII